MSFFTNEFMRAFQNEASSFFVLSFCYGNMHFSDMIFHANLAKERRGFGKKMRLTYFENIYKCI